MRSERVTALIALLMLTSAADAADYVAMSGEYPRDRIARVIDGRHVIEAHGTHTMPVWGEDFSTLEIGNPDAERGIRLIIGRLADYVWLLQRPQSGQ